jgi:hypothetical protein
MQIVPLIDAYGQTLNITLGGQSCRIDIKTRSTGLYCDLYVNDILKVGGVACRNLKRIVINRYFGFVGDLMFSDTQGVKDPSSPGLGTRYLLMYIEQSDLDASA